jgi:uncharacterized protein (TIGR03083 family)
MDDAATTTALERVTQSMAATVAALDPSLPVPTCPDWDVTTLVDHLGRVHLWAEAAVRTGAAPDPYPRRDRGRDLAEWYAASAEALCRTLGGREADAPAWSFSAVPAHATVGFWRRRQLHETAVHHVDALVAAGSLDLSGQVTSLPVLSAQEAADGVGEVLEVFVPRMLVRRADEPPEAVVPATDAVALACSDVGVAWTLRLRDGVPVVDEGVAEDAVATVSGPATHLYLALWHRADPALLGVEGDVDTARRLLDASLVP